MEIVTKDAGTKIKWSIDASHSEIGFKVKHLMISNIRGTFKEFEASIYTTSENFITAEIDCWINPSSINTNDTTRDTHLKGAEFLDAENFKEINFTADTFERETKKGVFELWGNLTMKGITKKIKLDVEFGGIMKDPYGNDKAAFTIKGKINRNDWGLSWNSALETGGLLLSEDVWINCEIQLVKSK